MMEAIWKVFMLTDDLRSVRWMSNESIDVVCINDSRAWDDTKANAVTSSLYQRSALLALEQGQCSYPSTPPTVIHMWSNI